jgi:hypothetical protein
MQPSFWSNTIWYILLGISTVIEIIFMIAKVKNLKLLIALFFTMSGMAFCFEVVMFSTHAYSYCPRIIPQLPLDDMVLGNHFSQFSITSTALLIAVSNGTFPWYFISAGIYCLIEEFFIKLGIYSHNWYQTWMTFVTVVLICWITKKIYESSLKGVRHSMLYIYIFFSFFNLYLITLLFSFKMLGIIDFNTYILRDAMKSYNLLAISNQIIITVPCMILYFTKLRWRWKSIALTALYIIIFIEYKAKLIYIKQGWFLIYATVEVFGAYLYVFMLDKLYTKKNVHSCHEEFPE